MTDFYKHNDNLLRDKLTQHEFAPDSAAWDKMATLLDQKQVVPQRAAGWWWSIPLVAAAALTGVISLGVYLNAEQPMQNQQGLLLSSEQRSNSAQEQELVHNTTNNTVNNSTVVQNTKQAVAPIAPIAQKATQKQKQAEAPTVVKVTEKKAATAKKSTASIAKVDASSPKEPTTTASTSTTANQKDNTATAAETQENVALANLIEENKTAGTTAVSKKYPIKKTRTIVRHQYSITPLRALQQQRKALQQPNTIGTFGIGDEVTKKTSPVKIGVYGGASTKIYGKTNEVSVMPFGGVSASYKVAPRHGLQAGLQYKSMGRLPNSTNLNDAYIFAGSNNSSQSHNMIRIDMLELPLVYQFYLHHQFNIHAGIKGAWLFNTEASNPEINNMTNDEMGLANFDVGVLVGMEYCFNKHWSLGLQYSLGLINLTQKAEDMHNAGVQKDIDNGVNTTEKLESLSSTGELLVPVRQQNNQQMLLRLPSKLHNNDVQLSLKYTF